MDHLIRERESMTQKESTNDQNRSQPTLVESNYAPNRIVDPFKGVIFFMIILPNVSYDALSAFSEIYCIDMDSAWHQCHVPSFVGLAR